MNDKESTSQETSSSEKKTKKNSTLSNDNSSSRSSSPIGSHVKEIKEGFVGFMINSNVLGFATGVAVGQAVAQFILSIIQGILMPPLKYFFTKSQTGDLEAFHIRIPGTPVILSVGEVISNFFNVLFIGLIAYFLIRLFFGKKGIEKFNKE